MVVPKNQSQYNSRQCVGYDKLVHSFGYDNNSDKVEYKFQVGSAKRYRVCESLYLLIIVYPVTNIWNDL